MLTLTKACPFCGQGQVIQVADDATEVEIKEAAIKLCCCDAAEKHKEMRSIRERVAKQFGEKSLAKFDDAFSVEVQEYLIDWAEKVFDGIIDKVVVTMENGDKATISRSGKRVKISREQKVKSEA